MIPLHRQVNHLRKFYKFSFSITFSKKKKKREKLAWKKKVYLKHLSKFDKKTYLGLLSFDGQIFTIRLFVKFYCTTLCKYFIVSSKLTLQRFLTLGIYTATTIPNPSYLDVYYQPTQVWVHRAISLWFLIGTLNNEK